MKKIDIHRAGRATHQALRDTNEVLVLNVVRERQPISRVDLAGFTSLEGSSVSNSLNPEIIVLGGTITRAWDVIYPEIRRVLATQITRFYASHVSITPSTLEERPSLVGAIALVLAKTFSIPNLGW